MFFLAWFHCLVYFRLLRHSPEVKGPEDVQDAVRGKRGEMIFLLALGSKGMGSNEEGAQSHVLLVVHPELLLRVKF